MRVLVVYVLEEVLAVFCPTYDKSVIHNPKPQGGGLGQDWRALTSNSSMKMLAMRGLMGDPIAAPWTCS